MKYATTDKLNDSMKAKVFKYRSDGNTVVAPYMELEPYAENVYLSLSRKNEYGNEDDDCFHVVCRIENVYFSSCSLRFCSCLLLYASRACTRGVVSSPRASNTRTEINLTKAPLSAP